MSTQRDVIFATLLALCACDKKPEQALPAAAESEPAAASGEGSGAARRWSPVRAAADVRSFEATGKLLAPPGARAELTLPLPASIIALRVTPGESVQAGQSLVEVMMPELARAQGQLEGARLRANAYLARLNQLEQLRGEGLVRGAELAEARARLAEAQAAAREAEALIDTVESVGVRKHGKHYDVVAPLPGVVVTVNAPIGSTRGPNEGPVCVISGGEANRVEARFGFSLPSTAEYELWALGKRQSKLRLVTQAPEVSANDATRVAWFELVDKSELPQGSAVRVRLRMPADTWVVPQASLAQQESTKVTTARGPVQVEVLTTFGTEALVRGALKADDTVAEQEAAP